MVTVCVNDRRLGCRAWVTALALAVCVVGGARAQSSPELELQASPISFPNPSLAPLNAVEFCYLISESGLEFLYDSARGMNLGGVFAQVVLFDSLSQPIDSTSQAFNVRKSEDPNGSMKIANSLRLAIPAGEFTAQLVVIDMVSKREASYFFQLPIHAPDTARMSISGVQLGHSLQIIEDPELAKRDPLIKNGRRLTPNPLGVYSTENPRIHMYAEVYGLQRDDSGKTRMGVRVELVEQGAEFPRILDDRFFESDGESLVYAQSLTHGVTTPGRSILQMIVTDAVAGVTDTSGRRIGFFTPGVEPEPLAGAGATTSPYDTLDHDSHVHMVFWLLSPRQRDLLESLTLEGQEQFINQFWRDNDPDLRTPANEFRDDVMARFELANRKYSHSSTAEDGWRTDPGRILMQYGFPDEVIEVVTPSVANDITDVDPWERWNYDRIQGGIYFIFSNERGYGEFILRHSNAQGERFDRGVEEQINQVFRSTGG